MHHKSAHPSAVKHAFGNLTQGRMTLIVYSIVMFFILFADSIMSFSAPVYIERILDNSFAMGLVLGFSSVVGIICDVIFAQAFRKKNYKFFTTGILIISFLFPLSFLLLPPVMGTFLFAMTAWGVYYEFIRFSNFEFIHQHTHASEHATAWGVMDVTRGVAATLGSFVASWLIAKHVNLPFLSAIGGFAMGLGIFLLLSLRLDRARSRHQEEGEHVQKKSFWLETKAWGIILQKIWPVCLVYLMLIILDSAFWTVGTLLSEEMSERSFLGTLVVPAYMIPSLFIPLFAGPISQRFGKKRTAFLACIPSGLLLLIGALTNMPLIFIVTVFLSSIFVSLASTELSAVFEDYVARLNDFGTDLIGLSSAASSIAYIVGPIAAGFIAEKLGNIFTFALYGGLMSVVAFIALIAMPRKTRLPQAALEQLESTT